MEGDIANLVEPQNEMLESQAGKAALRSPPSPTDREENKSGESCTGSDNSEGDDDVYHATTAQSPYYQRSRN